jgi:hypothetical protein
MTTEDIYDTLINRRDLVFENIETYIAEEATKKFLFLVKSDKEHGIMEFKIGQHRILFQSEINPYNKPKIVFRTYDRQLKLDSYPLIRFRNLELSDLRIFTNMYGDNDYENEQQVPSSFVRARRCVNIKQFKLEEFASLLIALIQSRLSAE